MQIHARTIGLNRLIQTLERTEADIADMKPFWRSVGEYLRKRTVRNFERERSPDGVKWKAWTQKYKARMEKKGKGSNKILSDTGALRRSVEYYAFRDRVFVGSNLSYARRHQLGDVGWKKGVRGGMPQRPFLGVTDEDRKEILRMMQIYFRRGRR